MLTATQWQALIFLRPSDFKNPDGLDYSIVSALDRFTGRIGARPLVLSDYRAGDPGQHGQGRAIDVVWPELDPLEIHQAAMTSGLFTGIGLYVNEAGAVSFHLDTRTDTLRDGAPDRWGGVITHPLNALTGEHERRTEYVAADIVIDILKKKGAGSIIFLIVFGWMLWTLIRR